MCAPSCFKWAAKALDREDVEGKRVLEVGSYDMNGSLRYLVEMLRPCEYIGVDIEEGPGVDLVCDCAAIVSQFGENSFDMVLSTCVLEHVRAWRSAVSDLKRICRPGGIVLLIVPAVWEYHEHPGDYWRFAKEDVAAMFSDCDILRIDEDPRPPSNVYAKMRKPLSFQENDLSQHRLLSIVTRSRIAELQDRDLRCWPFLLTLLKYRTKKLGLAAGRRLFRQL